MCFWQWIIKIIKNVAEKHHAIFALKRVRTVVYGYVPYVIIGKNYLDIFARFEIIASQSGQVLCDNSTNLASFNVRHHSLKAVAFESHSRHTVVNVKLRIRKFIILNIPKKNIF